MRASVAKAASLMWGHGIPVTDSYPPSGLSRLIWCTGLGPDCRGSPLILRPWLGRGPGYGASTWLQERAHF